VSEQLDRIEAKIDELLAARPRAAVARNSRAEALGAEPVDVSAQVQKFLSVGNRRKFMEGDSRWVAEVEALPEFFLWPGSATDEGKAALAKLVEGIDANAIIRWAWTDDSHILDLGDGIWGRPIFNSGVEDDIDREQAYWELEHQVNQHLASAWNRVRGQQHRDALAEQNRNL